ncbi:WD40 repeat-like protein [Rickenella mellea]|uniref:WD40 repeat-like protein n=1 Tax=Rickenella mellea TaxID=50990 RepID=A0A4Y7QGN7_9AGAM|nr:WD40 repeat-like protein [Rickenella mellea]
MTSHAGSQKTTVHIEAIDIESLQRSDQPVFLTILVDGKKVCKLPKIKYPQQVRWDQIRAFDIRQDSRVTLSIREARFFVCKSPLIGSVDILGRDALHISSTAWEGESPRELTLQVGETETKVKVKFPTPQGAISTPTEGVQVETRTTAGRVSPEIARPGGTQITPEEQLQPPVLEEVRVLELTAEDHTLLEKLRPIKYAAFDPTQTCLRYTREKYLEAIALWAKNDAIAQRFLWINGLTGSGKSFITASAAQRFHNDNQLGASFFCRRDDFKLNDPRNVLPSLSFQLASRFQAFGKAVSGSLRRDSDIWKFSVAMQYQKLFDAPLRELRGHNIPRPLIIVVDGLDECGTPPTRRPLLIALEKLSKVPWLKVMTSSLPHDDVRTFISRTSVECYPLPVMHGGRETFMDIYHHVKHFINHAASHRTVPPRLLEKSTQEKLSQWANGIFIWAATALRFIFQADNPDGLIIRLDKVLSGPRIKNAVHALHILYSTILTHFDGENEARTRLFQQVIGAVVASRHPLPVRALCALLHGQVGPDDVLRLVEDLSPVLWQDPKYDQGIRLRHPSFADFLTHPANCPARFFIDLPEQNVRLARECLSKMTTSLKFNICGLETSHIPNSAVKDLATRRNSAIPIDLRYSCIHWASHLADTRLEHTKREAILRLLDNFLLRPRALYWLEVLSLIGEVPVAADQLSILVHWIQENKNKYSIAANDMLRFVISFYDPISTCTPHLYISALPLAPKGSVIYKQTAQFRNIISIAKKGTTTWSANLLTLSGHTGRVTSVAFSPDGERVATGSEDHSVVIWDAKGGSVLVGPIRGHSGPVNTVAFSPNGRFVVAGSSDKTIRVWNAESGTHMCGPLLPTVRFISMNADGKNIGVGCTYANFFILDTKTGQVSSGSPDLHNASVNAVAFSPDGLFIVSASDDKAVRFWDSSTGASISGPLTGHTGEVLSVAVSPDSTLIASSSRDKTIRIWDARSYSPVGEPLRGHSDAVSSVAFSHDGRLIVSGSWDKSVRLWHTETRLAAGEPLRKHDGKVTSVSFSPDDRHVVSGSEDKRVLVWDATTRLVVAEPLQGHTSAITSVAFSADGRHLIAGSADKNAYIWDAGVHKAPSIVHGNPPLPKSVEFYPYGPLRSPTRTLPVGTDGWVRDAQGALVLWVPAAKSREGVVLTVPESGVIAIDSSKFVHGTSWVKAQA